MNEAESTTGQAIPPVSVGKIRLSLAGTSRDRDRLLLVDDQGGEFTLEITPDLRAAVRGETTRLGQLEIKMSSSIRPREIQIRIRAGESAETVAEAAGTTVEAIMPYVAPVLAEREHVAERALKASLRRAPSESAVAHTQSRVLGDAVAAHLRGAGDDPSEVTWDAYRRETGRWVLTAEFTSSARTGTARFTYDAPGNYALCDNDEARWLVGDVVADPVATTRDDLQQVRERRLAAVPADELPLGDLEGSAPAAPAAPAAALDEPYDEPFDQQLDLPVEPTPAPVVDEPIRATVEEPAASESTPAASASEAEQAKHRRPVQKKRGRASVPSWDEIMFGGSDQA
ncbi:hypothetical protein ASE01_12575 [Nocardioides sp. Root190]|uniref:septation protein SepH n=1 Tax=Nocardioides sp. Root190 TaxID=1736488 RepID=UPI0006FE768B|nr:septation protein SepH [Nocardioides sp. Root190]KRB75884.1 hypothetical protein ASE01_12575 [Nocardioides sp. Root190]